MSSIKTVAAAVAATLAITAAASSAQAQDENWSFEVAPYLWGAGLDTEVTIGPVSADVERDFGDVVDAMDIGGGLMFGGRLGGFVAVAQVDYLSLDSDELDDAPARGRLESEALFAMAAAGYRFDRNRVGAHVDLLFGARNLSLDNTLSLDGLGAFESDKDFVDPIVMLRPSFPLGRRWRFQPTISYGAGGDSEKVWELQPHFHFQINDNIGARFGYRQLYYEIESDNGLSRFDGSFKGLIIGIGGTFGASPSREMLRNVKAETAPAAAVAPPPPLPPRAVPPPPRDTDGDSIVDNIDKCPSTARGEKVDPVGCAYNVHINVLFETNSATLAGDQHEELGRLVAAMNSTPTLSAIIEGHTDSAGTAEHNQDLSERRAGTVAGYLVGRGINANRLQTKGFGELRPIADNTTAEGRAQNRRVVLLRPDAD